MELKESIESSNMLNCKGENVYLLCYDYEISPFEMWCLSKLNNELYKNMNYIHSVMCGDYAYLNPSDEYAMYSTTDNSFSDKKSQEFSLFYDPQNIEMYDEETVDKYGIQKIVDESGRKNVLILKVPKAMIGAKDCEKELYPLFMCEKTDFVKYHSFNMTEKVKGHDEKFDELEQDYIKKYGKFVTTINSRFVYGVQRDITGKVILSPYYNCTGNSFGSKYSVEQQKYLKEHGNNDLINKVNDYDSFLHNVGYAVIGRYFAYKITKEKYQEIERFYSELEKRTLDKYMPKNSVIDNDSFNKTDSQLEDAILKAVHENKAKNGSDGQEMI